LNFKTDEHHVGIRTVSLGSRQGGRTQWHEKSKRATINQTCATSGAIQNVTHFRCTGSAWLLGLAESSPLGRPPSHAVWNLYSWNARDGTSFSYLPQLKKAAARLRVGLKMLASLSAGLCLWVVYGVAKGDWIIILANSRRSTRARRAWVQNSRLEFMISQAALNTTSPR
jgi:hypothetical protein